MIIEATATGKTLEEAKEAALLELGAPDGTDVEIEVLAQPKAKTLGLFGGSDAKVRVFAEVADKKATKKATPQAKQTKKATKATDIKSDKIEATPTEKKPLEKSAVMGEEQQAHVVKYLTDILSNMGVENITVDVVVEEDGTKINFDGEHLGVAIGRKGETLDSLQHLVSLVANRKQENYVRITLNPGGYRQKRESTLISLAEKSAQKAIKTNKNIILEPMNSYERRIIHNSVQKVEGVDSWSIGENEHRRVCIGTSRDNKPYRENNRGGRGGYNRGGYNRGGYNRGGYNKDRRPSQRVENKSDRAPKADSNDMPLYGVIK